MQEPRVCQLAMCTANMPETIRRYTEVFRFADAGGDLLWGSWLGKMQEVGDDVSCTIWWLMGRSSFCQLEFFHHTVPAQQPLPVGWKPSDLGWVRWGMAVPDFDDCLERMHRHGLVTYTEPIGTVGMRRVCFRDPDTGTVVEVLEEGPNLPGGNRASDFSNAWPALVYAAASVPDLERALAFFTNTAGFTEVAPDTLHEASMDSLWGLQGATRSIAVVAGGGVFIELVEYDPAGASPPPDRRLTDQGFMNVAFGYRERERLDVLADSIEAAGFTLNTKLGPPPAGTYGRTEDGLSFEILSVPQECDGYLGFMPRELKIGR